MRIEVLERWPSGLRRTPGKRVYRKVTRVRIPVSPQEWRNGRMKIGIKY